MMMATPNRDRAALVFKRQFAAAERELITKAPTTDRRELMRLVAMLGKKIGIYAKTTYEKDIRFGLNYDGTE